MNRIKILPLPINREVPPFLKEDKFGTVLYLDEIDEKCDNA